MEQESSELVLFFGRFHPLVLHLPIGFLVIAFVLEMLSRLEQFRSYRAAVSPVLLFGAVSAVVAAALGYMLAQGGGYNKELLTLHQWLGIGAATAAVVTLVLHQQARRRKNAVLDKAYVSTLSVMVLILMGAGHFGGSLTHGSDYLTQYMPNPLRAVAGLPPKEKKEIKKITNLNEAVVFTDIIYPIVDAHCTSCHNDSKSKGDLKMHTVAGWQQGGEGGPIFMAGNATESALIKRIHLPLEDEEHMPPEGKSQLTDEHIALLTWWINQGASFDKTIAQVTVDDEIQPLLDILVDPAANQSEVEQLLASEVNPVDEQTLDDLRNQGIQVAPLADEVHWLQVSVPTQYTGDDLMGALAPIREQLVWLDLGNTSVTDDALQALPSFQYLMQLHLENTQITSAGLAYLQDLSYLEYLNLYGTPVDDEGIQQLASLKNLKKLYLWQTDVTKEGVEQLQEALPTLEINTGVTQDSVAVADANL